MDAMTSNENCQDEIDELAKLILPHLYPESAETNAGVIAVVVLSCRPPARKSTPPIAVVGPADEKRRVGELRRPTGHATFSVAAQLMLTEDEANEVDFEMGEHMYRHSISNNINRMGCDVGCRTDALRKAVNKVFAARVEELSNDGL